MNNELKHLREFGKFRLDAEKKVLWFGNETVNLQLKEIELLSVLTEYSGEVVTKDELLNRVWADSFVEESNLARHIYQIRKVFKQYGEAEDLIKTVPRRGYRFTGKLNENGGNLIIERHSISRTLIEELENSDAPNLQKIFVKTRRFLIPTIALAVLLTTAFGFYFYNRNADAKSIKSIAVLPLKSLDENEDKALGLGVTDTLITNLSKLEGVKIISTKSVSRYADETQEPTEIGKKLGVDAVLDGTLQTANGKLRVTLRLIRMADGKQIWASSFDKPTSEIFALQDLLALETAQALALNLKPKAESKPPTENLEAYQLYLQGQYFFRRRETSKGGTFYKKAVELDPNFAQAWAGLAAVYAMGDAMPEAETTVNKALQIAPDLAEAHAVRGFIKMFLDWDWTEAEKSLNRAVELAPNSVEAHHWRGTFLTIRRRFDEAEVSFKRALELDPTSANLSADLGLVYFYSEQYEKAEETFLRVKAIDARFANYRLRELYEKQGREREAFELIPDLRCRSNNENEKAKCLEETRNAFEKDGLRGIISKDLEEAFQILADKKTPSGQIASTWYSAALLQADLGENAKAIESLNRTLEVRARFETINFTFPFVAVEPKFAALRNDAHFQEILQKLNL